MLADIITGALSAPRGDGGPSGTNVRLAGSVAAVAAGDSGLNRFVNEGPAAVRSPAPSAFVQNALDEIQGVATDIRAQRAPVSGIEAFVGHTVSDGSQDVPLRNTTSRTGKAAKSTGLVVSMPSIKEINAGRKVTGETAARLNPRSSLNAAKNLMANSTVARAVKKADDLGHKGQLAHDFVYQKYGPKVARQVGVPTKSSGVGVLARKTVSSTSPKFAKFAAAAPIVGTAFDAYNVYDEFTDPDSTLLEKTASIADLALGITGAPLVLDLIAGSKGHDGIFSMLVGDKD